MKTNAADARVYVVCDINESIITEYTYQLIRKAIELRNTAQAKLTLICFNYDSTRNERIASYPIDQIVNICIYNKTLLIDYNRLATDITNAITLDIPSLFLIRSNENGHALASALAIRLKAGLIADSISIRFDKNANEFVCSRMAYYSSCFADITYKNSYFKICTVKDNALTSADIQYNQRNICKTEMLCSVADHIAAENKFCKLINYKERKTSDLAIKSNIVLAGGIGLRSKDNFLLLERIANIIGAQIGATRAVVEAGWCPYCYQIGQSGKIVTPDLYVAFGISGTLQHVCGMHQSKTIIAVNIDRNAPICKNSDHVIIEDAVKVLKELLLYFNAN